MLAVFMNEVFRCPKCNSTFFGSTKDQKTGKLIRRCNGTVNKVDYSDGIVSLVAEQCKHEWNQDDDDKFRVVEFKNTTASMRKRLEQLYLEMLRED